MRPIRFGGVSRSRGAPARDLGVAVLAIGDDSQHTLRLRTQRVPHMTSTPALEISGLSKTYKGGVVALKGIDLVVEQGEFYALLGPNGAGKSTTIGIVCALVNKTGGTVKVFGHDTDKAFGKARRHIGLVPQEFNFNGFEPLLEIVANQAGFYGIDRSEAFAAAARLLQQLGLWDKRGEMARELSGGMKRRLMIARALVHQPRLLILDEPTAGVDIDTRRTMWAFLEELNRAGTTIILTTHYLEEAENLCRHIAIIDHGRLVEHSSMRTLLKRLHQETFILYLRDPLDEPPELDTLRPRLADPRTLEIRVPRDMALNSVFDALSARGIQVLSMKNKAGRLEEVFVDMVGGHDNGQASA